MNTTESSNDVPDPSLRSCDQAQEDAQPRASAENQRENIKHRIMVVVENEPMPHTCACFQMDRKRNSLT